jgi:hypothetical protein
VAHDFDSLDDGALHDYLTTVARERGDRLMVEEREDDWVAEFRPPSGLGVIDGANGPDRRTAMRRLVDRLARDSD